MPEKPDWVQQGDAIVAAHDGQMYFNLSEARKITGFGENTISRKLKEAGILVKRGRDKKISAYDISTMMTTGRVSPVE